LDLPKWGLDDGSDSDFTLEALVETWWVNRVAYEVDGILRVAEVSEEGESSEEASEKAEVSEDEASEEASP
jgi:hypothetical protein